MQFARERGRKVIELLVGSTLVGGLVVYWYGYRTLDRIQKWGDKLNDLDAIFQSVATAEEMAGYSGKGSGQDSASAVPVGPARLHVGVTQ